MSAVGVDSSGVTIGAVVLDLEGTALDEIKPAFINKANCRLAGASAAGAGCWHRRLILVLK